MYFQSDIWADTGPQCPDNLRDFYNSLLGAGWKDLYKRSAKHCDMKVVPIVTMSQQFEEHSYLHHASHMSRLTARMKLALLITLPVQLLLQQPLQFLIDRKSVV